MTECITYAPDGYAAGFASGILDSFRYVDQDIHGATDTAWVFVKVQCCVILAVSDSFNVGYGDSVFANVLRNDVYNDSFPQAISILPGSGPAHGVVTVIGDSIKYVPNRGFCGSDGFSYILSDMCGLDTALVEMNVMCDSNCNKPVAVRDVVAHGYVCNDTINVLANDTFQFGATVSIIKKGRHGRDTVVNNQVVYIPDGTHPNSVDSVIYSVCNQPCGLCDTGTLLIRLSGYPCNVRQPIIVNDTVSVCKNTSIVISALANDSDPNGSTMYISSLTTSLNGTATNGDSVISYLPNTGFVGIDSFSYLACNTGVPNLCNTAVVYVNVLPCLPPPIVVDTLIRDTTYACTTATFCIDSIHQGAGYSVHFTAFCDSAKHGAVTLSQDTVAADSTGKLCFTYTASCDTVGGVAPYSGNDTICLVICDIGTDTACTVAHVIITILPSSSHPIAVNDCSDTTTYKNIAGIIDVLANDKLFAAKDTLVTIVTQPDSGVANVNDNFTITYVPNYGFVGHDSLRYQVCEVIGQDTNCSIATVCINVIDTSGGCFYPNGFSPNGDGSNDMMVFPCNDRYPNSSLQIFNRWGDVIWQVTGGYKNDWNGVNQSGTPVPDGTYYFVYKYNDNSGRSEARFIVINR